MHTLARSIALAAGLSMTITAPASANDLPLTDLTLYRSGVGSFTHSTTIDGTHAFDLRFAPKHVDDVLKSLLMLDTAPESDASVRYQSNEDLRRRLSEFSINLNEANSVSSLLAQLRGSALTLTTTDGKRRGTILGVEKRHTTVNNNTTNRDHLNLITSEGIRSVPIDSITAFEFDDKELAQELEHALATLVDARTDTLREMDLTFTNPSAGRRPIAVSYVHEMPVWKSAYKLVVPRDNELADEGRLTLQAWAIVENTTSTDWENVNLALAAGRPISFTMNLDQAIYAPRVEMPVPVAGGHLVMSSQWQRPRSSGNAPARQRAEKMNLDQMLNQSQQGGAGGGGSIFSEADVAESAPAAVPAFDTSTLGRGLGTGDQAGGQFLFRLDAPITLASQQSAMLPIATTEVTGEPVSIYSANAVPKHPLLGIRFTNDTNLHLMPGPVTIYDDDTYAGDAQIPHTSRGEEHRLTYALDLDIHAELDRKQDSFDVAYSIDQGLLRRINRTRITWTYTFTNRDDDERTLLLEHTKAFGPQGTIVDPEDPDENKKATITRELTLDPGETESVEIIEQRDDENAFELAGYDIDTFIATARQSALSRPLIDAMKKAARMKTEIEDLNAQLDALTARERGITDDQSRIRNNMNRLDRDSDLYQRYYKTLSEQEDTLENIRVERVEVGGKLLNAREALRDFLANLSID